MTETRRGRRWPGAALTSLAPGALALAAAAVFLAACEVPKIPPPDVPDVAADAAADAAPRDTGGADDASPFLACDRANGDADCPAGMFCHTLAEVCVDCLKRTERCGPTGALELCEEPRLLGPGAVERGFFEPVGCGPGEVCVTDGPISAHCAERVCEPLYKDCLDPTHTRQCTSDGAAWVEKTCGGGQACYDGACQRVRHNVLLIFDTSGSMNQYVNFPLYPDQACGDGVHPCLEPFPACEDPDDPITLITMAKRVFADNIEAAVGGHVQFALQRFPQRELLSKPGDCKSGWYFPTTGAVISGDDDAMSTQAGGWFDAGMGEAIIVPFPKQMDYENTDRLLEWFDMRELLGGTSELCNSNAECASGLCGEVSAGKRCFTHTDNELRAAGETPLGKSLFYAGEYFRRFVRVDGKPCQTTHDCGSAGYLCHRDDGVPADQPGRCVDPYAHCRDNFIVLFTDGAQNPARDPDDFFNPQNQAKRLAFGLGCQGDDDCRGGATCQCVEGTPDACTARVCVGPGQDASTVPRYVAPPGLNALTTPDGEPLRVSVSVVNLAVHTTFSNGKIARAGGGQVLDVSADDLDTFQQDLLDLMRPPTKCSPEDY